VQDVGVQALVGELEVEGGGVREGRRGRRRPRACTRTSEKMLRLWNWAPSSRVCLKPRYCTRHTHKYTQHVASGPPHASPTNLQLMHHHADERQASLALTWTTLGWLSVRNTASS
jgi:hypothetical protein